MSNFNKFNMWLVYIGGTSLKIATPTITYTTIV